jgi:hypothetical protein
LQYNKRNANGNGLFETVKEKHFNTKEKQSLMQQHRSLNFNIVQIEGNCGNVIANQLCNIRCTDTEPCGLVGPSFLHTAFEVTKHTLPPHYLPNLEQQSQLFHSLGSTFQTSRKKQDQTA